jgi:hypothetical protein
VRGTPNPSTGPVAECHLVNGSSRRTVVNPRWNRNTQHSNWTKPRGPFNHAVPIGEGLVTAAACATPGVDVVSCPEAIVGVAAGNVTANDVQEYDAVEHGCSAGGYLRSDLFELTIGGLGLSVYATVKTAQTELETLSPDTAPTALTAETAINYVNGVATGSGLGFVAAKTASHPGSCGCAP